MAAMISANAAGPPQWQAAPPFTACTSIKAIKARVARGSASVTSSPFEFFTWSAYFGGWLGAEANLGIKESGFSGGASTGLTAVVSAAINSTQHQKVKLKNLRAA